MMMNDSDPHPQAMQPHTHNHETRDANIHPLSNARETSTVASTDGAHGRSESVLRRISQLEVHNTRLYQDNCQLVNAVNMLNDRLAFVGASQNAQVLHLADVQEKLRASDTNRNLITRKYQDLLHAISADSAHQHLATELVAFREAYTKLEQGHRALVDKYSRLKASLGANQQQLHGTAPPLQAAHGIHSVPPNGALLHLDQYRINAMSHPSAISLSVQNPIIQQQAHQRRSSEGVIHQPPGPPMRIGTSQLTTTYLPPLPTPPPSAPVNGIQWPPAGFFISPPKSAGPQPLPRRDPPAHTQRSHGTRTMSGPPILTDRPAQQSASRIPEPPFKHRVEPINAISNKTPNTATPQSSKRPSCELQASTSPAGAKKRPRLEEEAPVDVEKPTLPGSESNPVTILSLSPVSDTLDARKPDTPALGDNLRSYEECVNLIFEKDADVENGVFCGLCLNRYEEKMIPEPPDVLVQPDFDLLVSHCMTMHPTVWEGLRHPKS